MRLFLTFTLLVIISSVQFGEGGIYRRYVRRSRPRPPILHDRLGISRREFQPYRPWSSFFLRRPTRSSWNFLPSRQPRRLRFHNQRSDNQRVPHFHHQQQPRHYSPGPHNAPQRSPLRWSPMAYGNPIVRDPTFDYAPPSMERVRLIPESRNRRTQMGGPYNNGPLQRPPPPPPPSYRPSPSLWKMLAHKQRPKRPYPPQHFSHNHVHSPQGMRYHGQSPSSPLYHHQAEIFPRIPNIVYFKPTDVLSSPGGRRPLTPPGKPSKSEGIGSVSSVPLNSQELTSSSSDLRPVAVVKPTVSGSKEYIFTVVGYKGPSVPSTTPLPPPPPSTTSKPSTTSTTPASTTTTTTRKPTILHAVKTTPITISSTHNSAVKPFEPTESLGNNHNHKSKKLDEVEDEESAEESKFVEVKSKESSQKVRGTSGNSVVDEILGIFDMVPPAPVFPIRSNSFNILDSDKLDAAEEDTEESKSNEDSDEESLVSNSPRRPVFNPNRPSDSVQTSTSVSVSVSKDEVTTPRSLSTRRPLTSPTKPPKPTSSTSKRVIETPRTTTEASTTPEPSTTTKAPKFANLPVMPKYTRNKTPVYAKKHHPSHKNINKPFGKYSSASSSSALSKEINGSGEIVVITGGRSKVKEYKPQFIADNSHLLSFDKVASDSSSTASSFVEVTSSTASPSSSSTTSSPLQQFDPMQLLHSWLTKSSD